MRAATDWASSAGPPEPPAFGGARTRCVRPTFQLTIAEVSMQPNVPRGNSRHSVAAGSLTEAKASPMTTTPTPPPEQHAAAHLDRATLTISRASEYLDAAELQAQTGVARERFAVAVLKELVDNALDAAEARGDPPEIAVTAATDVGLIRLVVADNGPGIDPATVGQILDYNQRVSSKLHYPSPTRGQLGNALKVVLGIPFALGGEDPITIEASGVRHTIRVGLDAAGDVRLRHDVADIGATRGTRFALALPAAGQDFDPTPWMHAFALLNPHAAIAFRREHAHDAFTAEPEMYKAVAPPGWAKWTPGRPIPPTWFDLPGFARLVVSLVNQGHDQPLGAFLRGFDGLKRSAAAKAAAASVPGARRLADLAADEAALATLLATMQRLATRPPKPKDLGPVGAASLLARAAALYGPPGANWYKRVEGNVGAQPFVVEAFVAEVAGPGEVVFGVNHSPSFDDPFDGQWLQGRDLAGYGLRGLLRNAHATRGLTGDPEDPTTLVVVHLVWPVVPVLDRGKSRVRLPPPIAEAAAQAVAAATKVLAREGRARDTRRDAELRARSRRARLSQAAK